MRPHDERSKVKRAAMITMLMFILIVAGLVLAQKTARRMDRLERDMAALQARLAALPSAAIEAERPIGAAQSVAYPTTTQDMPAGGSVTPLPSTEEPSPPAGPVAERPTGESGMTEEVAARTAVPEGMAAESAAAIPQAEPDSGRESSGHESFESWLGARWAVWVGGLALALGGIFLVRYSIESGLLGPGARLSLAVLFGLVLGGAGELVRRRALPQLSDRFSNAMIPGALTAAGAVTLLGAVFAAYAVYGFIGPTPAFIALAIISLATVALSLLHGQALAALGLLASLATPALLATDAPNAYALFGFLTLVWMTVNAAARWRRWTTVPMLANIGLGLWLLLYLSVPVDGIDLLPATLALLAMIAGTGFLWPGRTWGMIGPPLPGIGPLLRRPPRRITVSLALTVFFSAIMLYQTVSLGLLSAPLAFGVVVAALAALGAMRLFAVWPAIIAAFAAVSGTLLHSLIRPVYGLSEPILNRIDPGWADGLLPVMARESDIRFFLVLGAVFAALGFAFLKRFRAAEPAFSTVWALLMPAVPVAIATIGFLTFGNLNRDWLYGLYGIGLGLVLVAGAEWLFRQRSETPGGGIGWPANILVGGSFAGFALALHALTNGIVTTVLLSALGFLYVLAMRVKRWPALPWMMAAATVIVFARIAWEPTVIGENSLGTTPFLNALLPGYGVPTLLAIVAAWMLRHSADIRVRNIMQALASLAALLTVSVLVRHAMNGGTLDTNVPTLAEQSIYTLISVGFSGILMTLDLKSPSPVFRIGSMLAGVVATINVLALHVFALNPYLTGEDTGGWPIVNLLLIGYLLPALAYALVAYLAKDRRPKPYVAMLAVSGGVLAFLWATLSVRRFWQGSNIADWKGFVAGETYSYSVVWLLIGVILLVLGSRFDQRPLRLASAGLVLLAVLKVFLVDMSNLEGILRALSFMGLGAVLIGIGLFYQRILVKKESGPARASATPEGNAS